MAKKKPKKMCSKCGTRSIVLDGKYCYDCRQKVIDEMTNSGYLTNSHDSVRHVNGGMKGRSAKSTNIIGGSAEHGGDGDE
jgi:predicted ATP-dependent serine protease